MLQVWQRLDQEIRSGLTISLLATLYAVVGYTGWLGEFWLKEGHDKVALLALVFGLGFAILGHLKSRAERSGTRTDMRVYKAALFGTGTLAAVFGIAVAVAAATFISFVVLVVATPWTSISSELFDFESSKVYAGAAALVCLFLLAAGGEWLLRRGRHGSSHSPRLTMEAALLLFIFCLAFTALSLAFSMIAAVARDVSGWLPPLLQAMVAWLHASINRRWLLPIAIILGAIVALIQAYRRRDVRLRSPAQQWTDILIVATAVGGCLNVVTFLAAVILHNTVLR